MADGRVIARCAGDTATGAFACVMRRALFGDRSRYRVDLTNGSADVAEVLVMRDGEPVHAFSAPPHGRAGCSYDLAAVGGPLVVTIACAGTTLTIHERTSRRGAFGLDARRDERRRAVAGLVLGATIGAASVVVTAAAVVLVRRRLVLPPVAALEEGKPIAVTVAADDATFAAPSIVAPLAIEEPVRAEPVRVTPLRRPRESGSASVMPLVAGGALAAALIGGFVIAHPHVGDLGAPNTVLEGSAVDVPYSSSGIGALRYSVVSSQGTTIGGGPLAERSGVLHIAIPSVQHNDAYRVRLEMSGPLGDASNEATIGASALPATRVVTRTTAVPLIRSFAVSRNTVNGAPKLVAYYDVLADTGTLRLIDARGIVYQTATLSPAGQTTFALPAGVDPGTLALELHAVRGGAAIDSRIALPAGGSNVAVASPPPDPAGISTDAPPISVPDRAVGGEPIRVQIVHHYPELHVSLLDENARTLVGIDVPRGASTIALAHPPVAATTRVTVEATYRVNTEADTIIRPVLLIPAGG
jgi:hypothetical protein